MEYNVTLVSGTQHSDLTALHIMQYRAEPLSHGASLPFPNQQEQEQPNRRMNEGFEQVICMHTDTKEIHKQINLCQGFHLH